MGTISDILLADLSGLGGTMAIIKSHTYIGSSLWRTLTVYTRTLNCTRLVIGSQCSPAPFAQPLISQLYKLSNVIQSQTL